MAMEIHNQVGDMVSELRLAVDTGKMYIDQLQERMDEIETTKDTLETCLSEAETALEALEAMSVEDFDCALEEASSLTD